MGWFVSVHSRNGEKRLSNKTRINICTHFSYNIFWRKKWLSLVTENQRKFFRFSGKKPFKPLPHCSFDLSLMTIVLCNVQCRRVANVSAHRCKLFSDVLLHVILCTVLCTGGQGDSMSLWRIDFKQPSLYVSASRKPQFGGATCRRSFHFFWALLPLCVHAFDYCIFTRALTVNIVTGFSWSLACEDTCQLEILSISGCLISARQEAFHFWESYFLFLKWGTEGKLPKIFGRRAR